MPRITLRVTEDMYQHINQLAQQQEGSLSTVAKQLISIGLQSLDKDDQSGSTNISSLSTCISLESLYLLKKLMYERFDYTQTEFEKVHEVAVSKSKQRKPTTPTEKI